MLLNLARNAAQALESDKSGDSIAKQIRFTGRREGAVTILEISDTGPGIPEKGPRAFVRGVSGLVTGRRHRAGLAIAAELIRAHGGELHLVDGTIGATFRITIPDRAVELRSLRDARARA